LTSATKRLAPILLLLLLFPRSTRAQGPLGAVEGTVLSEYGNGIGGAIVTLEPLRLVEYSDQNGAFAFHGGAGGHVCRAHSTLDSFEARSEIAVVSGQDRQSEESPAARFFDCR